MGNQRTRRRRRHKQAAAIPQHTQNQSQNAAPKPRTDPDDPHPPALIFAELAEEYDGLPSPAGTAWGQPSMPARGVARVIAADPQ